MLTHPRTAERSVALPLLFNFREVLFGSGFVVEVRAVNGRALCVHEDGGSWIYGVNPGGMSAFGDDEQSARREFRQAFSGILREIALECASLEEFAAAVKAFVHDTNKGCESAWRNAVETVRRESISVDGLEKLSAEAELAVTVTSKAIGDVQTTDNKLDLRYDLAA